MSGNTRSVRKVSGLLLYLRAIVFKRPLRGMNINRKASRTYRLLAGICRTYSSCVACLCLQSYFWVRRILWLLKMTEKQDQRICIKFCFQLNANLFGSTKCDMTIVRIRIAIILLCKMILFLISTLLVGDFRALAP